MKRIVTIVAIAAVANATCALAQEQEKKIKRTDLPAAVEITVARQSRGATIHGLNEVTENGKTNYEVEMTVSGHSRDILIAPDGDIVEIEEQIDFASLPADVQNGLRERTGNGKLGKVESLTKHDIIVAYESVVTTNGKKADVQVGPDGERLGHEE